MTNNKQEIINKIQTIKDKERAEFKRLRDALREEFIGLPYGTYNVQLLLMDLQIIVADDDEAFKDLNIYKIDGEQHLHYKYRIPLNELEYILNNTDNIWAEIEEKYT